MRGVIGAGPAEVFGVDIYIIDITGVIVYIRVGVHIVSACSGCINVSCLIGVEHVPKPR